MLVINKKLRLTDSRCLGKITHSPANRAFFIKDYHAFPAIGN
jgi:hypothetical protein